MDVTETTATTPGTGPADGTAMRRCVGTSRYGIEPHDAPVADFPLQPSQRDGIGRMCKPHWSEYVRRLAVDAKARKEAGDHLPKDVNQSVEESAARRAKRQAKAEPDGDADRRRRFQNVAKGDPKTKRAAKVEAPVEPDPELVAARDLVARIDAMPADEAKVAYASDEAQAALDRIAKANGNGHGKRKGAKADVEPVEAAEAETPAPASEE